LWVKGFDLFGKIKRDGLRNIGHTTSCGKARILPHGILSHKWAVFKSNGLQEF